MASSRAVNVPWPKERRAALKRRAPSWESSPAERPLSAKRVEIELDARNIFLAADRAGFVFRHDNLSIFFDRIVDQPAQVCRRVGTGERLVQRYTSVRK